MAMSDGTVMEIARQRRIKEIESQVSELTNALAQRETQHMAQVEAWCRAEIDASRREAVE